MGSRITHFEIPSDDPEKSMKFYNEVFGWSYHQFGNEPYWMAMSDEGKPGINGAIMKKKHPDQPLVTSFTVENLDEMTASVERAGGTIVVAKMPVPSVGWLAYFKDPDGNIHGMMQEDRSAK